MNQSTKKGHAKTDQVVDDYAHQIFLGLSVSSVPPDYQKKVLNYLKDQKSKAIEFQDFKSAQKFEDKINEMELMQTADTYDTAQNGKLDELYQRLESAQNEYEEQREIKNRVLEKFQIDRDESISKLVSQLNNELLKFDEDHDISVVPPKFRKFSPEYLNLRKREKFMVSSKRYVEANNLKKEADAREVVEREKQQQNWENYVYKQRDIYMKKQEEQRRCFVEKWDREWAALLPSAENEVKKYENAVKAIEAKINISQNNNDQQMMMSNDNNNDLNSNYNSSSKSRTTTARGGNQTNATAGTSPTAKLIFATTKKTNNNSSGGNSGFQQNGNLLPPLSVAPTQADPLRSRLTYIRATNYNRSRQRKINEQRGGKRAKTSVK